MAACARGLAIILLPALPEVSHSFYGTYLPGTSAEQRPPFGLPQPLKNHTRDRRKAERKPVSNSNARDGTHAKLFLGGFFFHPW
jgi:hypothetical protein